MKTNKNEQSLPEIVMLSGTTLNSIIQKIDSLHEKLDSIKSKKLDSQYLTAMEFMEKTKLSRSTFDDLRLKNQLKGVIKKGRKIYIPASEVTRFFEG